MRLARVLQAARWRRRPVSPGPPKPWSILVQAMNFPPEIIGAGKYTGELVAFLETRGHAVEVIAALPHYPGFVSRQPHPWLYERTKLDGIQVTRCPLILRRGGRGIWRLVAPLSFAITAAPVLLWRVLRTRPDVVLCIEPTLLAAPMAIVAAKLAGAKLALHVQDLEVDAAFATAHLRGGRIRSLARMIERRLLGRFDAVITISDAMAARLAQKGVAPPKLSVVRNWVDLAKIRPVEPPGSFRAMLGIGSAEPVVLYAGNLGAKQDFPTLLEALRLVAERREVRVVIAGQGPMAGMIEAASSTLPKLVMLPLQPADRIGDLLAMADVHVLPQDGRAADLVFPSKLGPMLATGRPVVVTANPDTELARWLGAGAIVVEAGAPAALAAALEQALAGTGTIDRAKARSLVETLDSRAVLPQWETALGQLIGRDETAQAQSLHGSGLEAAWVASPKTP